MSAPDRIWVGAGIHDAEGWHSTATDHKSLEGDKPFVSEARYREVVEALREHLQFASTGTVDEFFLNGTGRAALAKAEELL